MYRMFDAIWHLLGTVGIAWEHWGGTKLIPLADNGDSQGNGRCRWVYKSHIDISQLLSVYSGKILLLSCSISHSHNGLCEPGVSWVLSELEILNAWGRRFLGYRKETEGPRSDVSACTGQSLVWMGRNVFQVSGTAPKRCGGNEAGRQLSGQGSRFLREKDDLMFL